MSWFIGKAKVVDADGKKKSVEYLVSAVFCAEAETKLTSYLETLGMNFEPVTSVSQEELFSVVDTLGENYYRVKGALVTVDESSGKEKTLKPTSIVLADSVKDAVTKVENEFDDVLSVSITPILDVIK